MTIANITNNTKNWRWKELMRRAIKAVYDIYGNIPVKIGAQLYLKRFYESFGFEQISDVYLEDGIKHISMQKTSS